MTPLKKHKKAKQSQQTLENKRRFTSSTKGTHIVMKYAHHSSYFLFVIFLLSYGALALNAYQPLRWSPVDFYVLKGDRSGPIGLKVSNSKRGVLEESRYKYNASGRLLQETYYNAKSQKTGHIEYQYKKNKLREERLFNARGRLLASTKFNYDADGRLLGLKIYGQDAKMLSEQKYSYKQDLLMGGTESFASDSASVDNEENEFMISYEKSQTKRIIIRDKNRTKLSEITYIYDSERRLKERRRRLFISKTQSRCLYRYDTSDGRLSSYIYQNKNAQGKWQKDKEIVLRY